MPIPALLQTRPSLAAVAAAVDRAETLSAPRRLEIGRDLGALCALLHRPPEEVPADAHRLRARLVALEPGALGISRKRLRNLAANLKAALACGGIVRPCAKPIAHLSPPWAALWAQIKTHDAAHGGWLRPGLSPLFRWADAHGLGPAQIDGAAFAAYATYRRATALGKDPAKAIGKARYAWNEAQATIPNWPATVLPRGGEPDYLLPLTAFPQSFQDDIAAYRAAQSRAGAAAAAEPGRRYRLRDRDAAVPRRPRLAATTLAGHVETLRLAASTLVAEGERRIDEIRAIGDVISPEALELVADTILARTGAPTEYGLTQGKRFRSIAGRWLTPGADERKAYGELLRLLKQDGVSGVMTEKNRARLRLFDDPALFARLVALPETVMAALERERASAGAVTPAMALAAEAAIGALLLMTLPVRRAALARTAFDRNIRWPAGRRGEGTLQYAPAEDTKTGQPLAAPLAPWKIALLHLYKRHYQPVLAPRRGDRFLFPGRTPGSHKTLGALAATIVGFLWKRLGVKMNLHLFRHLMASKLLEATDGNLLLASNLLGHSDGSRVTAIYAEIRPKMAARQLEAVVERETRAARGRGAAARH